MQLVDWLVVAAYLLVALGVGLYFVRKASASMEDYFIAGRSLPWWVIGFANCATYTGASGAWVMLIFADGLVGNFWWWASWVIWMPLVAVLWARYWRRMRSLRPPNSSSFATGVVWPRFTGSSTPCTAVSAEHLLWSVT